MAKSVQIFLIDDLDGSPAERTTTFALNGVEYEIDLSADHAAELRSLLDPYIAAGRRSRNRGSKRAPRTGDDTMRPSATTVRAWARSAGVDVPRRGRIPADILRQFEASQRAS